MAPGEIGSFTISPMFCWLMAPLFVCPAMYVRVCVRATFDRFRSALAHKRGFIIPACIFHEDLSLQLFRECACESDCSFYLHSHISSRRFFRCFSLPAHTHTHTHPFILKCMHGEETRPEAQARKQWRRCLLEDAPLARSLAFNRRLCHYYFLLRARASVVREQEAKTRRTAPITI